MKTKTVNINTDGWIAIDNFGMCYFSETVPYRYVVSWESGDQLGELVSDFNCIVNNWQKCIWRVKKGKYRLRLNGNTCYKPWRVKSK